MNYIIDPMWFYWASVSDCVSMLSAIIAVVLFVALIIAFVIMAVNTKEDDDYEEAKKIFKIVFPAFIFFTLMAIFIPTKSTLLEMLIAKYTTYDNAEWTIEAIKNVVDYILEAMKSV